MAGREVAVSRVGVDRRGAHVRARTRRRGGGRDAASRQKKR